MKLSIIIPVHNEENFIEQTLEKVAGKKLNCEKEIIVINDGSSDGTEKILEGLRGKYELKLLSHRKNQGKGAAIKTALKAVTGDMVIIQDADLEYDPVNIPSLLTEINDSVSAVYGKRSSKIWPERGFHYILGAKLLTFLINILYGSKLRDVYTGYKLFNLKNVPLSLLQNLESAGFEFEAEITCKILKMRGKIIEVPIDYRPRSVAEGKHINWADGLRGIFTILKFRFKK